MKVLQRPWSWIWLILVFPLSQAFVDTALCGFTPLFGRSMPYLLEVDLGEHYFIQGPRHARSEAIGHFARLGEFISLWYLGQLRIDCNHIVLTNQDRHRSHTALISEDLSNEIISLWSRVSDSKRGKMRSVHWLVLLEIGLKGVQAFMGL